MQTGDEGATAVCPSCGRRGTVVPNPYYGSGLAVHESLVQCPQCGIGFLDNEPPVHAERPPRRRGLGARLAALFRR